jgi:hypothetical protein
LAQAEAAEADSEPLSSSVEDFVKNVDVYTDEPEEYEKPEKPRRFTALSDRIDSISPKLLVAAAATLSVFVILTTVLVLNLAITTSRVRAEHSQRGHILRVGDSASNSAMFMFANIPVDFTDKVITLTKVNMSRISTVLYFDGAIDLGVYDAFLTDDWGRTYYIDYSFYENGYYHVFGEGLVETRLWFDALPLGFNFFDLTITKKDTQERSQTRFTAGQSIAHEAARFLSGPIIIESGIAPVVDEQTGELVSAAEVQITSGVFSNTGSPIGFAVRPTIPGEEVVLGKPDSGDWVTLTENGRFVAPDLHSFAPHKFDEYGVTIGRTDFVALNSLDSIIRIRFDEMYRKISVENVISLAEVFHTKPSPEYIIDAWPYRLVIERGGIQGNQFVLVMHALDMRTEAVTEMSNRVQAFPDVAMVARKADGSSIRIEPRLIRDSWQGTDVVFDGREESEFLFGISTEQVFFEFSGVLFKLPPAYAEIDLSMAERYLPINPSTALETLTLMFDRRLEVKTGLFGLHELDRFSPIVLADRELMSYYQPTTARESSHVVHVPMWFMDGDRFFAIARETWRAYPNEFFHRVHKTVSEFGGRTWVITEDEIIE